MEERGNPGDHAAQGDLFEPDHFLARGAHDLPRAEPAPVAHVEPAEPRCARRRAAERQLDSRVVRPLQNLWRQRLAGVRRHGQHVATKNDHALRIPDRVVPAFDHLAQIRRGDAELRDPDRPAALLGALGELRLWLDRPAAQQRAALAAPVVIRVVGNMREPDAFTWSFEIAFVGQLGIAL